MHTLFTGKVHIILTLFVVVFGIVIGGAIGVYIARDTIYNYTLSIDTEEGKQLELQYGVWPELAKADFFHTVRDGFITDRASFVEANLTAMSLRVYRDGVLALEVPIKSKGREGSWWETPSGLYRAQAKERNHFSSFGHVYMPWSIPFQGNFFIHGWPYHEDGTPVPEGYSGGCIRLTDEYAEQVFALVEVGIPILVFEEEEVTDTFAYMLEAPNTSAASYLVADLENNYVLLAGNTNTTHETDLLRTMMTALVASEYQNIEKRVTVQSVMLEKVRQERLAVGSSYSLYDLFFPLLLEGSPEAQSAVAGYFGERRFRSLMEAKAAALGMTATSFSSDVADQQGNTTSTEDLFLFLKYLHTNRPFILSMSAGNTNTRTYGAPFFVDATSTHPFRNEEGFLGGATHYASERYVALPDTTASVALVFASSTVTTGEPGHDLITVLEMPFNGTSRYVAFIVLDSKYPAEDTRELITFAERMYR